MRSTAMRVRPPVAQHWEAHPRAAPRRDCVSNDPPPAPPVEHRAAGHCAPLRADRPPRCQGADLAPQRHDPAAQCEIDASGLQTGPQQSYRLDAGDMTAHVFAHLRLTHRPPPFRTRRGMRPRHGPRSSPFFRFSRRPGQYHLRHPNPHLCLGTTSSPSDARKFHLTPTRLREAENLALRIAEPIRRAPWLADGGAER